MEDNYLKEKFKTLQNMENNPSNRIWNQLEGNLKSRKEKSFQKIFNISVAAALIIIFSVLLSQLFMQKPEKPPTAQEIRVLHKDSLKSLDTIKPHTKSKPHN